MNYTLHSEPQGSDEWKAGRDGRNNASELVLAAGETMNGRTRTDLIRKMATGIEPEVDAFTQKLFDDGHRFEELARQLAEKIIGRDLYPITISMQVAGLKRPLGASLDGATDDDSENFEHKVLNAELRSALTRGFIPPAYHWQMEEGQMINGATRTLFMASKWDDDNNLLEELHLWYESNPELRAKIVPIWKQAEADAEAYQHVEAAPVAVAAPINELPALMVEITGSVTASNLSQWREIVVARIAGINTDLQTDQDFADADQMVKFLDDGEKRIDLVKSQAQANAADIDRVFRALDEIKASMRAKRLELDKLVKARKESIRIEIQQKAAKVIADHVAALSNRIGMQLPPIPANFAVVMKNKRTVASLQDAVDTELATLKIDASAIADRMEANIKTIDAAGYAQLFADRAALVFNAPDHLALVIKSRIADHKAAEAKREEETRQRIRIEEEARAAAKVKAEQEEAERAAALALANEESNRRQKEEAELQRKAGEEAAQNIEVDRIAEAYNAAHPRMEPATQTAAPPTAAEIGGYTGAPAVVAAHTGVTGVARLLDRLDDLARQMTELELSELCIHAAHILSSRQEAA